MTIIDQIGSLTDLNGENIKYVLDLKNFTEGM